MCPLSPFPPSSPPHPSWLSPSTGFGSLCQTSNSFDPLSGTCRLLGNGHFFLVHPHAFWGGHGSWLQTQKTLERKPFLGGVKS